MNLITLSHLIIFTQSKIRTYGYNNGVVVQCEPGDQVNYWYTLYIRLVYWVQHETWNQ